MEKIDISEKIEEVKMRLREGEDSPLKQPGHKGTYIMRIQREEEMVEDSVVEDAG